jgi:hypothetical protein
MFALEKELPMARRHDRAQQALNQMTQRVDALLNGVKQQVADMNEVGKEVLTSNQNAGDLTGKLLADITALWINGLMVGPRAFFGFPAGGQNDDEE